MLKRNASSMKSAIAVATLSLGLLTLGACESAPGITLIQPSNAVVHGPNPHAPGFNREGSDSQAITIANRVMRNMGGRNAWDATRYISWNFFGWRTLYWDKETGNTRIEYAAPNGNPVVLLYNINTREGTAYLNGQEVEEKNRAAMSNTAWRFWVNDSYWLIMPYKLKDTGVTLKYLGTRDMENGRAAEVLQLTFDDGIGVTPENRYEVFIGLNTGLVEQWSYFAKYDQEKPTFTTPWTNWQQYGRIKLSHGRGTRTLSNIAVFDELPESVFTSPAPVVLPGSAPADKPEG